VGWKMKIVFFSFYYPPDLSAGSFRSVALSKALVDKIGANDELHVITTQPNRYKSHRLNADSKEISGKVKIHRIKTPFHKSGMISQAYAFIMYAIPAFIICRKIKPHFLIGTSSRLMTGVLTCISAKVLRLKYYIDLRDIFSETISDIFALKSNLLSSVFGSFFSFLDKKMLNSASGVNVVSEAFPEYFQKKGINTSNWSFFPNGIDEEFLSYQVAAKKTHKNVTTVMYAGNIGKGQGLELVVPKIAKLVGHRFRFVIIGDGGAISLLKQKLRRENIDNVEILPPVSRPELIDLYLSADIMFLHLNNIKAFQRVLPSKIFEYIALKKPIVAGLSGYSAKFLKQNVPHAFLFNPGDYNAGTSCLLDAVGSLVSEINTNTFVAKYSRSIIMEQMATQLINLIATSVDD
jgi:glycosyltransferase involved in cell wall biosynthesis